MTRALVELRIRGPVVTGQGPEILAEFVEAVKNEVANQALADVHERLDEMIRFPTPYYETQVTVEPEGDTVVVHDRGIVYGPWLEGISPKNSLTKFRGYRAFQRAGYKALFDLDATAARVLRPFLRRLRGN